MLVAMSVEETGSSKAQFDEDFAVVGDSETENDDDKVNKGKVCYGCSANTHNP